MKPLFCSLLLTLCAAVTLHADIQAPPASNQGPTRKLGRGFSNLLLAVTDWQVTIAETNDAEGNQSIPYGFVKGAGRFFARTGTGLFDVLTFPFPLNKEKYTPVLQDNVRWINGGYSEFPPELGWESRYDYGRSGF